MEDHEPIPPGKTKYLAVPRRKIPEPTGENENEFLEIKNPILANLFHYGMVGLLLVIVFLISGTWSSRRGSGGVPFFIFTGVMGAIAFSKWIKSNKYYDEDKGGF